MVLFWIPLVGTLIMKIANTIKINQYNYHGSVSKNPIKNPAILILLIGNRMSLYLPILSSKDILIKSQSQPLKNPDQHPLLFILTYYIIQYLLSTQPILLVSIWGS